MKRFCGQSAVLSVMLGALVLGCDNPAGNEPAGDLLMLRTTDGERFPKEVPECRRLRRSVACDWRR